MIRHGQPPYLECSSRGDRRFSAFSARLANGCNIEQLYQAAKVFPDGSTGLSWREAKGRRAVNQAEVAELYAALWRQYIAENPTLLDVLCAASGLSDLFGQHGHCCQATELWAIRTDELARRSNRPLLWCNVHQRKATAHHERDNSPCCDPALGGIMLPCRVVDLTGLIEIDD